MAVRWYPAGNIGPRPACECWIGEAGRAGRNVVPGLTQELSSADPPEHLQPYCYWDFWSFHSPDWWRRHWERSGVVSVELAEMIPDGSKHWIKSDEISAEWQGKQSDEADMLRVDAGRYLGFTRMVGRRKPGSRWRG